MARQKLLGTCLLICLLFTSYGQEICNNAIDDDNDGLIDYNDDDCNCFTLSFENLFKNPSFEQRDCCPTQNNQLDCATDWEQVSAPTSDFVSTCGDYLGNTSIPAFAPLPMIDGEGAVGFRDGNSAAGPSFKEYVGACLIEPIFPGVDYELFFYVGFQEDVPTSSTIEITVFGGASCDLIPYGGIAIDIGCPANVDGFDVLSAQVVSGNNEWVLVEIDLSTVEQYDVVIIGPPCSDNPNYESNPYFFIDDLQLLPTEDFRFDLDLDGQLCQDQITLGKESTVGETYQWYKEGIALLSEISSKIELSASAIDVNGTYMLVVLDGDNCRQSVDYSIEFISLSSQLNGEICEPKFFALGDSIFTEAGYYQVHFTAENGCDSTVNLTLTTGESQIAFLDTLICQGDYFSFKSLTTNESGIYEVVVPNSAGCDSLFIVSLDFEESTSLVEYNQIYEVVLGEDLEIYPSYINPLLENLEWTNEAGQFIDSAENLVLFNNLEDQFIYLSYLDENGCLNVDTVFIQVLKEGFDIYVPNTFTPNDDGLNDYFRLYGFTALKEITLFSVFDRWGTKVYEEKNVEPTNNYAGWSGSYNGRNASQGIYVWTARVTFLDGTSKFLQGSVSLTR